MRLRSGGRNHCSTISVNINKMQVADKHSFAICPFLIDINIIDLSGKTAGHKEKGTCGGFSFVF